ncbi:MAG: hypothetical protein WCP87_01590 [Atribacterota bacterium]
MVFFGATGNLFSEKIFPAFYHLLLRKKIHNFRIIASGRRFSTETDYHQFLQRILEKLFDSSEILFYLSTLPSLYLPTIHLIQKILLPVSSTSSFHKIIIEKPFGSDAKSFLYLVKTIQNIFTEENIFLVDHYLGKETVQNIIILKAENLLIEKMLSRDFVEEIHIVVLESEGVGRRGAFYEETGAIRDMVQNHILQLISLIAMDVPSLCKGDKKECRVFMEKMTLSRYRTMERRSLLDPHR